MPDPLNTHLPIFLQRLASTTVIPVTPSKALSSRTVVSSGRVNAAEPKTGMIDRAAERFNIDLSQSWIIGDSTLDLQTGANAGMGKILVLTGQAGTDGKYEAEPDHTAADLLEAVSFILDN